MRRYRKYRALVGGYVVVDKQPCAFSIVLSVSKPVIGGSELQEIQKRIAREVKKNQDVAITSISKLNIK
ncbi:hypothetical protein [Listeria newyorkensis]|uniref:hypothetical protein n=1 Tax=Listeria newyorkensis TaxID=1497681 RepID=UPI00112FA665|nr:hypothetical protein [Listeria newyorkensis]